MLQKCNMEANVYNESYLLHQMYIISRHIHWHDIQCAEVHLAHGLVLTGMLCLSIQWKHSLDTARY